MYPFFFAIVVCSAAVGTTGIDNFYKTVPTLSLALDPRDYIVPPTVNQSNEYVNLDKNRLMMISEINIFYYKHMLTTPVSFSLTFSHALDYQITFIIEAESTTVIAEGNVIFPNINFVREDGKMMRFYACFLGKLCRMNAVPLPYPMNKFKIEADDSHSLLRIFIKSFILSMQEVPRSFHSASLKSGKSVDVINGGYRSAERLCHFQVESNHKLQFIFHEYFTSRDLPVYFTHVDTSDNVKVRLITLPFAIVMGVTDRDKTGAREYKLFTATKLITRANPLKLTVNAVDKDPPYNGHYNFLYKCVPVPW